MMRASRSLILAALLAVYVTPASCKSQLLCADVDGSADVTGWDCKDAEVRTYSKEGTPEYYLSLSLGYPIRYGISLIAGTIDLGVAAVVNIWNAFVTAAIWTWNAIVTVMTWLWNAVVTVMTELWNVVETVMTWLWNAFVAIMTWIWNAFLTIMLWLVFAVRDMVMWFVNAVVFLWNTFIGWIEVVSKTFWTTFESLFWTFLGAIRDLWTWWYPGVWNATIMWTWKEVGGWSLFFIWIFFILYCIWAVLGLVVCGIFTVGSLAVLLVIGLLFFVVWLIVVVALFLFGLIAVVLFIVISVVATLLGAALAIVIVLLAVVVAVVVSLLGILIIVVVAVVLAVVALIVAVVLAVLAIVVACAAILVALLAIVIGIVVLLLIIAIGIVLLLGVTVICSVLTLIVLIVMVVLCVAIYFGTFGSAFFILAAMQLVIVHLVVRRVLCTCFGTHSSIDNKNNVAAEAQKSGLITKFVAFLKPYTTILPKLPCKKYLVHLPHIMLLSVAFTLPIFIELVVFLWDLINISASLKLCFEIFGWKIDMPELPDLLRFHFPVPSLSFFWDMTIGFENFYLKVVPFGRLLMQTMGFRCPGGALLLSASQMFIAIMTILFIQARGVVYDQADAMTEQQTRIEEATKDMKRWLLESINAQIIKLTHQVGLKFMEIMVSASGWTFVYLVKPPDDFPCDYEGDILLTILGYCIGVIAVLAALMLFPRGLVGHGISSYIVDDGKVESGIKRYFHSHLMMARVTVGYWSKSCLERTLAPLKRKKSLRTYLCSCYYKFVGLEKDEEYQTVDPLQKNDESFNETFCFLSADIIGFGYYILPMGALAAKMTTYSNKGFILRNMKYLKDEGDSVTNLDYKTPLPKKWTVVEKVLSWMLYMCLIVIPVFSDESILTTILLVTCCLAVPLKSLCRSYEDYRKAQNLHEKMSSDNPVMQTNAEAGQAAEKEEEAVRAKVVAAKAAAEEAKAKAVALEAEANAEAAVRVALEAEAEASRTAEERAKAEAEARKKTDEETAARAAAEKAKAEAEAKINTEEREAARVAAEAAEATASRIADEKAQAEAEVKKKAEEEDAARAKVVAAKAAAEEAKAKAAANKESQVGEHEEGQEARSGWAIVEIIEVTEDDLPIPEDVPSKHVVEEDEMQVAGDQERIEDKDEGENDEQDVSILVRSEDAAIVREPELREAAHEVQTEEPSVLQWIGSWFASPPDEHIVSL